jgi:tetratricopeptide (TPR) repeat protein
MLTGRNRNSRASDCPAPPGIGWWRKKGRVKSALDAGKTGGKRAAIFYGKRLWFGVCIGWLSVLLGGCAPPAPGQSADEREPHFVLGENRVDAMDYRGAIQAFEESLEADPHSAAAHFQLGWLYDAKVPDPAAAIYHYEQYLKLDPDAGNAAVVKQRIEACKQKLAEDVLGLPDMPAAQRRVEQLTAQNQQLQEENQQLRAGLNRWSVYCASLLAARTNPPPAAIQTARTAAVAQPAVDRVEQLANPASGMSAAWRTHMVVAGETAVGIARRYGVSLAALLAANPGLVPRRMPVGLILNIPPPHDCVPAVVEVRR